MLSKTVIIFALIALISGNNTSSEELFDREKFFTNIHTIKLEGNTTFAYYYTNIYVGTPPQRQTVIVGTGSHQLAFPCDSCTDRSCGIHMDKPYERFASLTYHDMEVDEQYGNYRCKKNYSDNTCEWSISYAEGSSLQGKVGQDYIILGDEVQKYFGQNYENIDQDFATFLNHERVKIPFGCTKKETNYFLTQDADGILGLSDRTNTTSSKPNIIDEMYQKHSQNGEQFAFSLCLANKNGGYMSVGGYNKELHKPEAETKIVPYTGYRYQITLNGITINGEQILDYKINGEIESGTTLLFGPKTMIKSMLNQIFQHCDQFENNCLGTQEVVNGQTCWRRDKKSTTLEEFFASFPDMNFNLDTFDFVWKPKNYLFIDPIRRNNKNLYCPAFESLGSKVLFGGAWMREYDILFDRSNKQLHFTESECNSEAINQNLIEDNISSIKTTEQDIQLFEDIKEKLKEDPWKNYEIVSQQSVLEEQYKVQQEQIKQIQIENQNQNQNESESQNESQNEIQNENKNQSQNQNQNQNKSQNENQNESQNESQNENENENQKESQNENESQNESQYEKQKESESESESESEEEEEESEEAYQERVKKIKYYRNRVLNSEEESDINYLAIISITALVLLSIISVVVYFKRRNNIKSKKYSEQINESQNTINRNQNYLVDTENNKNY